MAGPAVRIPDGRSGHPTVSATQLRAYGAGGFGGGEQPRGCPRQYRARYVDRRDNEQTERMAYGILFHRVQEIAVRDGLDPYEVLPRVFPATMEPALMAEARRDLDAYLARPPSPLDGMHPVAVELDVEEPLYTDEVFGPVWYRAIIDKVLVDPENPDVLHVVDYKTRGSPPSRADLAGDMQLRGQAWLMHLRWPRLLPAARGEPQVVSHLDATKWRDVALRFSAQDLADWRMWAQAVCRAILRDDDPTPRVNAGCSSCMVRHDCPALAELPARGGALAGLLHGGDLAERAAWRDEANAARLLLEKAVKAFDDEVAALVLDGGPVTAGGYRWEEAPAEIQEVDLVRLRGLLGADFWEVVTAVKGRARELVRDWPAPDRDRVLDCWAARVVGSRVKRVKDGPR